MTATRWITWLAVALQLVLSSVIAGGPGKMWLPFVPVPAATAVSTPVPTAAPTRVPTAVATPVPTAVPTPAAPTLLGIASARPAQVKALGGSWYYDYGPSPERAAGVEAVPMIFGETLPQQLGGNSAYLLGMNEPDKIHGANLTPEQGAAVWRKIELAFPNKLLVSPAPSHEHLDWLVRFREVYKAAYGTWPRLDALAMHCYDPTPGGCTVLGQKYVELARAWGVPAIWVTEFAFIPKWAPNAEAQTHEFVAWMMAEPLVTRYAPWTAYVAGGEPYWPHTDPAANPSLFTGATSTELTTMGRWYVR